LKGVSNSQLLALALALVDNECVFRVPTKTQWDEVDYVSCLSKSEFTVRLSFK